MNKLIFTIKTVLKNIEKYMTLKRKINQIQIKI